MKSTDLSAKKQATKNLSFPLFPKKNKNGEKKVTLL